MVHTTDGRASVDGRTAPISSLADRQLFHALRTRVDAIMVGAGTLRIERYGRMVPDAARREQRRLAGLQPDPLAIVVSGSLDLPADLPLLQDADSRVVIVTASERSIDGVGADVQYLRFPGGVDLPAALAQL
jgi:riboflavin biosynthesis pyrimidine reductase